MSAFQSFVKGKRRPPDSHNHGSSKKLKYGLEEQVFEKDGTKVADDPTKIGEQFWIVQWSVLVKVNITKMKRYI